MSSSQPTPFLNRYAKLLVAAVFVLLGAGALVTGNAAGLSIPDWPLAYGRLVPPFVSNIRFEYTHRVIATAVGLLTIGLVIWLWRAEPRRWLRWLGGAALGCVVLQGVLGGLTVLKFQPPWLSAAHASVAQLFLLIAVAVATFTSPRWLGVEPPIADSRRPSLFALGVVTCAVTYVQLILGAGYRHGAIGVVPHLVGALVVAALLLWCTRLVIARNPGTPALRRPALLLLGLLAVQLALGVWSYQLKLATRGAPQPDPRMVLVTTLHLLCGASVLATTLLLTLRARRWIISGPADLAIPAIRNKAAGQAASL